MAMSMIIDYILTINGWIYFISTDLSKAWAKQVQRTRKDWEPTKYSVLCSEHFTRDSFDESALLRAQMGIATKRTLILKKGAIPTVFPRVGTSAMGQPSTSTSRPARSAFATRERKRVKLLGLIC